MTILRETDEDPEYQFQQPHCDTRHYFAAHRAGIDRGVGCDVKEPEQRIAAQDVNAEVGIVEEHDPGAER